MRPKSLTQTVSPNDISSPFIIWTLRRTGGTNLATYLFDRSPRSGIEHEPLNPGRYLGYITEGWQKTGDRTKLRQDLKGVLEAGPLIKHCVETVPQEVTECLAELTLEMGYKHIFLFRRQPLNRLLSLYFANTIGIWGKTKSDETDPEEISRKLRETDIPIARLIKRERADRNTLSSVFNLLQSNGMVSAMIQFEDIYDRFDREVSIGILERLIDFLGINAGTDRAVLDEVLFKGDQKTRHHYRDFRNYLEFEKAVADLPPCILENKSPVVSKLAVSAEADSIVTLFDARRSWRSDLVRLEGVGAMPNTEVTKWYAATAQQNLETFSGLPSGKFANNHPSLSGASHARFVILDAPEEGLETVQLTLVAGDK